MNLTEKNFEMFSQQSPKMQDPKVLERVNKVTLEKNINPEQFKNPVFRQVLYSLCYCLTYPENEEEMFFEEEMFLSEFLSIICNDPRTPEIDKGISESELIQMVDAGSTIELETLMNNFNEDSILYPIRQHLGIQSTNNENYFIPLVVPRSQVLSKGLSAAAFVLRKDQNPSEHYLVIPDDVFRSLVDKDDSQHLENLKRVRHEYIHTQRQFRLGRSDTLGMILDERIADNLSKTSAYPDLTLLFQMLNMFAKSTKQTSIMEELQVPPLDDKKMEYILQIIVDLFGDTGLIYLYALTPKLYDQDSKLLPPGFSSENRLGELLEKLIYFMSTKSETQIDMIQTLKEYFREKKEELEKDLDKARSYLNLLSALKLINSFHKFGLSSTILELLKKQFDELNESTGLNISW